MEAMKTKPFPWMCPDCRQKTVSPVLSNYQLPAVHDGSSYDVVIRDALVPTCSRCGQAVVTDELSAQITDELRRQAGLLGAKELSRSPQLQIHLSDVKSVARIHQRANALACRVIYLRCHQNAVALFGSAAHAQKAADPSASATSENERTSKRMTRG